MHCPAVLCSPELCLSLPDLCLPLPLLLWQRHLNLLNYLLAVWPQERLFNLLILFLHL
jgi:hypothetical protein